MLFLQEAFLILKPFCYMLQKYRSSQ